MKRPAAASRYQPHPHLDIERRMRRKLEEQTGKTWAAVVRLGETKGPKDKKALTAWYRAELGLSPMQASWLALTALGAAEDYGDPEPLVDALYAGARARLRPLHEALVDLCNGLGPDVTVTACKTMVPVYRKHLFADLRPVADGVRLRLALGDLAPRGRLSDDGAKMPGERLTHAVTVRGREDLDAELKGWLAAAYARGASIARRSTAFEMPAELTKGLRTSKAAAATWATMTPAMQRDMAVSITTAKQAETRARRLAIVLERLADGQRRLY